MEVRFICLALPPNYCLGTRYRGAYRRDGESPGQVLWCRLRSYRVRTRVDWWK